MVSASGIGKACPAARGQVLRAIDHGCASLAAPRRIKPCAARQLQIPSRQRLRPNLKRFLNTTARHQSEGQSEQRTAPEETERFVRETRQRFRDTLPTGYLSEDEYKVYERLYGPPIRVTEPEDVGIRGSENDDFAPAAVDPEAILLREVDYQFEEQRLLAEEEDTVAAEEEGPEQSLATAEESVDQAIEELEQHLRGLDLEQPSGDSDAQLSVPATDKSLALDGAEGYINATARNKREFDALMKLQRDFESASLKALEEQEAQAATEEELAAEEEGQDEEDLETEATPGFNTPTHARQHPFTAAGKFGTYPSTISFPKQSFIQPVQILLRRTSIRNVTEAAEKVFGGEGLPYSPATPASKKNIPMKPIGLSSSQHFMSEIDADAYISAFLPPAYASAKGVLVEVRKRLGAGWLRNLLTRGTGAGPQVLDVGGGGAGLLAWQEVIRAEWQVMRDEGLAEANQPPGKQTMVVGNDNLRYRLSRILENTTFLPRLPDYVHLENKGAHIDGPQNPQPRKSYDVILASHSLLPVEEGHRRKAVLNQLWSLLSPDGGVLVILEKGHPRGFEAVAEARQRLLDEFLVHPGRKHSPADEIRPEEVGAPERVREPGMIVAPCTNHAACPMYLTPGRSAGRKDFCHFSQQYLRPPFLQSIMGASARNHGHVEYSYVVVQRGAVPDEGYLAGDAATDRAFAGYAGDGGAAATITTLPNMRTLPRNVLPPIKRTGHVTLDLCTPSGRIERWTVPKSFGAQAYRDARKARWGDLWALGAKTRVRREVRAGRAEVVDDGGVRARRAKAGKKARVITIGYDERGITGVTEAFGKEGAPVERRTKGGRRINRKLDTLIQELEEGTLEEEEDKKDGSGRR